MHNVMSSRRYYGDDLSMLMQWNGTELLKIMRSFTDSQWRSKSINSAQDNLVLFLTKQTA